MGRREVRELIQKLQDDGKTVFFSTHILSDAEALCDRVAVIHEGELRGVGVVAQLCAGSPEGRQTEIVWNGAQAAASISALGAKCRVAGDTVRASLPAAQLDAALDLIRRNRGQILSVTPASTTLEDYFLQKIRKPDEPAVHALP
jgi:ABC-2 type transport system ATP-binding protein